MSEEIYDDSVTNPKPQGELDFQAALEALPEDQRQELADKMQSHINAVNSLRDQAITQKAQNIATSNFNFAMDAFKVQNNRHPSKHEMASMYAAARKRAGFLD